MLKQAPARDALLTHEQLNLNIWQWVLEHSLQPFPWDHSMTDNTREIKTGMDSATQKPIREARFELSRDVILSSKTRLQLDAPRDGLVTPLQVCARRDQWDSRRFL